MPFLGIDGGGSKTAFAVVDDHGRTLGTYEGPTTNYNQIGFAGVEAVLSKGLSRVLQQAELSPAQVTGAVVGIGGAGEIAEDMPPLIGAVGAAFGGIPHAVVNDCEVGWAGALALEPGINVISGTGSIAFGRDESGRTMRCGGWAWTIGDEGSAHWLGRQIFQIFTKQSDGRLDRTPLYDCVRRRLNLSEDIQIRKLADEISRTDMAAVSLVLIEAMNIGDETPLFLYREAARELALHVRAIRNGLAFRRPIRASGTGGVFASQPYLVERFSDELTKLEAVYQPPKATPVMGAVLLAVERYRNERLEPIRSTIVGANSIGAARPQGSPP